VAVPAPAPVGPPAPPGSEPLGALSLDVAVRRAVEWNPSVEEAVARIGADEAEIRVARAGYYPTIRGGIGTQYDNRLRGSAWLPRPQVSVSQMLLDFGKVSSDVAVAQAGVEISRAQLLLAVDSLVRDTAQTVVEIQRHEALIEVANAQLESVLAINTLVQQRTRNGASTRSDAVQAEARVEAARVAVLDIQAQLERWRSVLGYLIGSKGSVVAVRSGAPAWIDEMCEGPAPDLGQVPTVLEASARREQATAELRRSRADALPTVSLDAGAAADVRDPISTRSNYNFGLSVSSSLFQGGASRARRAGAEQSLRAANAAVEASTIEVGRALAEARQQIPSLRQRSGSLGTREAMMRETGKLYRLQYLEMGTRTLIDLLNAEQELHQVLFDRVNAEHDLRRLGIDCMFNKGQSRDRFALSGMRVRGVTL
jgi:adhesin transport system outer membrane protein